jgi:septal ring factor EnvC (AmiA/AmiB activator)
VTRRVLGGIVAAITLLGILAPLAPVTPVAPVRPAWAQAEDDEEAQRKRLEQIDKEAAEKRRRARELKGKEQTAVKDLRRTETSLRRTRRTVLQLNQRERRLESNLTVVRTDLDRSERSLSDRRTRLAERLRGLYKAGRGRELGYLLGAESFAQLFLRTDFLARVARQDRLLLLGITREKDQITRTREKLDATLTQVEKTAAQKKREQDELARLRRKKQTQVSSIQSERKSYEAAAAELEQTARRIQSLLAELERRRREEEERRRRGIEPGQPVPLEPYRGDFAAGRGKLPWPVRGEVIGNFGNEKHPRWGTVVFNGGIDIRASLGADVRAVAKGRVDYVSEDYGAYGAMLILNHGDGYYTLYAHLSAILVGRSGEVESGQVVARVGDSGSLKGPMLHFEVRQGKKALNPQTWLR